ncbi:hypothetical protein [Halopolyspora algeriensis]|uniref:hypothetical protein n=1 Tax=Halopolyspora algeriensis TaxID=1500506 RepID=UPI001150A2F8|nr:hypothetical protein [Halopolyspora algeriensis]
MALVSNGEHDDARAIPDDPQDKPEETVEALEERALGTPEHRVGEEESEEESPAIEQDLDAQDMHVGRYSEPPD